MEPVRNGSKGCMVCRPSFGSVLDWFQNGPVEIEGLSGLIFGPDLN